MCLANKMERAWLEGRARKSKLTEVEAEQKVLNITHEMVNGWDREWKVGWKQVHVKKKTYITNDSILTEGIKEQSLTSGRWLLSGSARKWKVIWKAKEVVSLDSFVFFRKELDIQFMDLLYMNAFVSVKLILKSFI